VTFTVAAAPVPPSIVLSGTSIDFRTTVAGSNPATQTVSITNGGGGTLSGLATSISYGSGQPTGWLTASLNATTAPTDLSIAARTGSLAAGTYDATVRVTSGAASNSPRTITVTFVVDPPLVSVPNAPSNLHVKEHGKDQMDVDWRDNSNNELAFILQRALAANGPWTDIILLPNTTKYSDTGLKSKTTYFYRVVACNLAGCSAPSNVASDRTK
jgi:hypothetical protein